MTQKIALITAGATIEPIDPVRYITNHSSGKQGYALADVLQKNGYLVYLISSNVNIEKPNNVNLIKVQTAQGMLDECEKIISSHKVDVALFAAAVCDWKTKTPSAEKLKKDKNTNEMTISFVKNPDILATIANSKNRPKIVVGFAAETNNLIENATAKLNSKNCDFIIANDVSKNIFASDENEIIIISKSESIKIERCTKQHAAEQIIKNCC